jgi:YggT family protein
MGDLICILLLLFQFAFLLRIVLSFFPLAPDGGAATVRDLTTLVTDPVVMPVRRAVPPVGGGAVAFPVADLLVLIGLAVIVGIVC